MQLWSTRSWATRGKEAAALLLAMVVGVSCGAVQAEEPSEDSLAEKALLAAAGEGFHLKRTAHFLVAFDTGPDVLAGLTGRLESTYASIDRFCQLNAVKTREPTGPLEVIFFDTVEQYRRYATRVGFPHEGTYGFYLDRCNRSAFFNAQRDPKLAELHSRTDVAERNLAAMRRSLAAVGSHARLRVTFADGTTRAFTRSEVQRGVEQTRKELRILRTQLKHYSNRINQMVVQHEAAHQILYNVGVHVRGAPNPTWLVEGLACLFETPPSASGAGLGATNQFRLADFREALGGTASQPRPDSLPAAIAAGRLVPLEAFIARQDLFAAQGERAGLRYAQAWALICYLRHSRQQKFAEYVRHIASRKAGVFVSPEQELSDFQAAFGPMDERFESDWLEYVLSLPFRSVRLSR